MTEEIFRKAIKLNEECEKLQKAIDAVRGSCKLTFVYINERGQPSRFVNPQLFRSFDKELERMTSEAKARLKEKLRELKHQIEEL